MGGGSVVSFLWHVCRSNFISFISQGVGHCKFGMVKAGFVLRGSTTCSGMLFMRVTIQYLKNSIHIIIPI